MLEFVVIEVTVEKAEHGLGLGCHLGYLEHGGFLLEKYVRYVHA